MKKATRSFYEEAVARAVERIGASLDDALDLTALARGAALSPLHFHRVFKGMLGETPLELHRRLRFERAAQELARGDRSVTEIAFDAGYETHESFTRAFGDRYATTPSAFRKTTADARAACVRAPQTELASRSGLHHRAGETLALHLGTIGEEADMKVEIQDLPAMRVAAVRHVGPYSRISEAFGRLHGIVAPAGLLRPGAKMLGIYHDDPETTPAAELRADAGVTVAEDTPLPAGLSEVRIHGGRYARAIHVGPYTELGDAWAQLMDAGFRRADIGFEEGPSFESYRNTPMDTPPEKLETELYLPIA